MFTSRAEYRLLLRQDNADIRLTRKGHAIGLASEERVEQLEKKEADIKSLLKYFQKTSVSPEDVNPMLEAKNSAPIKQKLKAHSLVSRPNVYLKDFEAIPEIWEEIKKYSPEVFEQVEIDIKYSGYINKEKENVEKSERLSNLKIPADFDYFKLGSLSMEARQKLDKIKPVTLAQASRISGVSPSDINVLMVFMGR
jgi:tRNA uridine 5-carboxymethylaminomethyl modification enzyme